MQRHLLCLGLAVQLVLSFHSPASAAQPVENRIKECSSYIDTMIKSATVIMKKVSQSEDATSCLKEARQLHQWSSFPSHCEKVIIPDGSTTVGLLTHSQYYTSLLPTTPKPVAFMDIHEIAFNHFFVLLFAKCENRPRPKQ